MYNNYVCLLDIEANRTSYSYKAIKTGLLVL